MFMPHPRATELGRARDALRELEQEHEDLQRWLGFLVAALDSVDQPDGWARVRIVELFLSQSLPRHFAFEEQVLFPALIERLADVGLARALSDLVGEHRSLMAEVKAFTAMTEDYDGPPPPPRRPAIVGQAMALRQALLDHARREEEILLPVLRMAAPIEAEPLPFEALAW